MVRGLSPYPDHQQLILQHQQEQERRRQSLTTPGSSRLFGSHRYQSPLHIVMSCLDTLTTRRISTEKDCTERCVICLSNFELNEELRELKCNHKFHVKCIDEWLMNSTLCPVCRADVSLPGKFTQSWETYGAVDARDVDFEMALNLFSSILESDHPSDPLPDNATND